MGSPLPISIAGRGLLKSRTPSSLRVRQHPAAAAPTDERQQESGRNKAAWAAPCPTSLLPLPEIRCNKIRCKYCWLTVWQTSPPSSLTIQPVSWLRLKLATLSHILVQEDEEEDIEIKGVPGFCWTREKAEWLWSRQTTEQFGVATTIEALKSENRNKLKIMIKAIRKSYQFSAISTDGVVDRPQRQKHCRWHRRTKAGTLCHKGNPQGRVGGTCTNPLWRRRSKEAMENVTKYLCLQHSCTIFFLCLDGE